MNRPPNLRHKIKGWVDKAKWFDQGLSFCTSQDLVLLVWSLFYHTPPKPQNHHTPPCSKTAHPNHQSSSLILKT